MTPEQKEEFKSCVRKLFLELKKRLNLKNAPKLFLVEDEENASEILGRTAHYDPETQTVKLFITGRHPKDILRSFSHECVHHFQNENEKLKSVNSKPMKDSYAQDDPNLRQMEKQAYLLGNMIFRDWEDGYKNKE